MPGRVTMFLEETRAKCNERYQQASSDQNETNTRITALGGNRRRRSSMISNSDSNLSGSGNVYSSSRSSTRRELKPAAAGVGAGPRQCHGPVPKFERLENWVREHMNKKEQRENERIQQEIAAVIASGKQVKKNSAPAVLYLAGIEPSRPVHARPTLKRPCARDLVQPGLPPSPKLANKSSSSISSLDTKTIKVLIPETGQHKSAHSGKYTPDRPWELPDLPAEAKEKSKILNVGVNSPRKDAERVVQMIDGKLCAWRYPPVWNRKYLCERETKKRESLERKLEVLEQKIRVARVANGLLREIDTRTRERARFFDASDAECKLARIQDAHNAEEHAKNAEDLEFARDLSTRRNAVIRERIERALSERQSAVNAVAAKYNALVEENKRLILKVMYSHEVEEYSPQRETKSSDPGIEAEMNEFVLTLPIIGSPEIERRLAMSSLSSNSSDVSDDVLHALAVRLDDLTGHQKIADLIKSANTGKGLL